MKRGDLAPRLRAVGALAALTLGASGCPYETTSVVKIPALETAYPVSASPHYVDPEGNVVRDSDYEVVEPFEFERTVKAPRHDKTETTLKLEPEIDAIVKRARGDAVTRLTIDAAMYDPGSTYSSSGWQVMGWVIAPLGVLITGVGIGLQKSGAPNTDPGALYAMGGSVLGVSALCFVLGAVLRKPAEWQYHVSGRVVRRRPVVPPPSAPVVDDRGSVPPAPPKKRTLD